MDAKAIREEAIKCEKEVLAVYKMLHPKPKELLLSPRRAVKSGMLTLQISGSKNRKPRYLFLFNDVLLITKREGKQKYWLKTLIRLRLDSVKLLTCDSHSPAIPDVEFRLQSQKKTMIFLAESPASKKQWIQALQACYNGEFDLSSSITMITQTTIINNNNEKPKDDVPVVEDFPPIILKGEDRIVEKVVEKVVEKKEEVFKFGGFDISEFDDDDDENILESMDKLTLGGISRSDSIPDTSDTVNVFHSASESDDDDDDI